MADTPECIVRPHIRCEHMVSMFVPDLSPHLMDKFFVVLALYPLSLLSSTALAQFGDIATASEPVVMVLFLFCLHGGAFAPLSCQQRVFYRNDDQ